MKKSVRNKKINLSVENQEPVSVKMTVRSVLKG